MSWTRRRSLRPRARIRSPARTLESASARSFWSSKSMTRACAWPCLAAKSRARAAGSARGPRTPARPCGRARPGRSRGSGELRALPCGSSSAFSEREHLADERGCATSSPRGRNRPPIPPAASARASSATAFASSDACAEDGRRRRRGRYVHLRASMRARASAIRGAPPASAWRRDRICRHEDAIRPDAIVDPA